MSLWSHRFSQSLNQILYVRISALYTVPHYRAEILTIFGSYFGRNDDFIISFWKLLTFSNIQVLTSNKIGWNVCCTHACATHTENPCTHEHQRTQLEMPSYPSLQIFALRTCAHTQTHSHTLPKISNYFYLISRWPTVQPYFESRC